MVSADNRSEDVQVLLEDQQRINRFSRLNLRTKELDTELDLMKTRLQTCRDAMEEAEMCLDPEGMLLTVGESFFQVSEEEAVEHLEKSTKMTEDMLAKYVDEAESARVEMEALKKVLYAKFGANINLEDR